MLLDKCLSSLAAKFLPGAWEDLYRSYKENTVEDSNIKWATIDGIKAAKRGCVEKRTLLALLCSTKPAMECREILNNESLEMEEADATDDYDEAENESRHDGAEIHGMTGMNYEVSEDKYQCHIVRCLIDKCGAKGTATGHNCYKCKLSIHIYCARALLEIPEDVDEDFGYCTKCFRSLGGGGNNNIVGEKRERGDSLDLTGEKNSKRHRSGNEARYFRKARADWNYLLCTGKLPEAALSKTKASEEVIRHAVMFLFRPENVQLLSWGCKRVKVDGEWKDFPSIMRKATKDALYRLYCNSGTESPNDQKLLGRSCFVSIAGALTRG